MEEGLDKPRKKNKLVIVIAVIIALVIIAGIIVLVIINSPNKKPIPGDESAIPTNTAPGPSKHTEFFEELNKKAEDMDYEEAKELYKKAISDAEGQEGRAQARVEYGKFLLYNNEADSAKEQFDKVDDSVLDEGYKILYYAGLRDYYDEVGDEAQFDNYNNKLREVITNSIYANGG